MLKRVLREPLLHFLVLGAIVLLLSYALAKPGVALDGRIVVSSGKIEQLATGFVRVWQRAPSAEELDGLIEDFVREEVLYREALAMGLDKDDSVIRRRLRQKFEFLNEDTADAAQPTDQNLKSWLDSHPEQFSQQPKVAFQQVFVSESRRGAAAPNDALKLLARLNRGGHEVDASDRGDTTMLPHQMPLSSNDEVQRVFGGEFARQLVQTVTGHWAGPLRSGYGLHLVYVLERTQGEMPALAEVREAVQREWFAARRRQEADASYRALRAKYAIVVEPLAAQQRGDAARQDGVAVMPSGH